MSSQSNERGKYPRTSHLPWSLGVADDDLVIDDVKVFSNHEVVITEKMDGENTTLTSKKTYARSPDSRDHPSRHWVKSLWAQIRHDIPPNMRICGENVYAQHTITYDALPSFFLVFGIILDGQFLSWHDTVEWCQLFNLHLVPVLYVGPWSQEIAMHCQTGISRYGGLQEGYVVRKSHAFPVGEFDMNIAKFVRKDHVQTSEHWMHEIVVPNKLMIER